MDILMDVLKDKKQLIRFLLSTIENREKESIGLRKLSDSLMRDDPNFSTANIAKCLSITMNISATQSRVIKHLAVIALIQCQSNDFDVDIANIMTKLGK